MSVKCYVGVEPEGERWKPCDLHRGLRTCYTKYDMCKSEYFQSRQELQRRFAKITEKHGS